MTNQGIYYPLWALVSYIVLGVAISIYGPLEYLDYDQPLIVAYISGFLLLFIFGYVGGGASNLPVSFHFDESARRKIVHNIFVVSCVLSTLVMSYELLNAALGKGLSLNILNSGSAYFDAYAGYVRNTGSYSLNFLIISIASVPLFITTIWGIYYFKEIATRYRLMVVYVIVLTIVIYTIGGGKQKQFGDLIIYFMAIWGMKMGADNRLRLGFIMKLFGFALAGVAVLLLLLAVRYETIGIDANTLNKNIHEMIYFKDDNIALQVLGDNVGFAVSMLSAYFGQGYYGLSLAMEQEFTWTAFAGSSYSVSVIANQLFGLPFMVEQSYPYLVGENTGWAETKWHSVFAWLASDLTFPGTLVFFGFVAFIYARAWKEAVVMRNPFAVLLFALLSIGMVYIPANNQLMHTPGGLFLLIVVSLLYFVFHKSFNAQDPNDNRLRNTNPPDSASSK